MARKTADRVETSPYDIEVYESEDDVGGPAAQDDIAVIADVPSAADAVLVVDLDGTAAETGSSHDGSAGRAAGTRRRRTSPAWQSLPTPGGPPSDDDTPTLDDDGHRLVLVDGEAFSIVEGDLMLDPDQKDLWKASMTARQMAAETQLRTQQRGLGEAAIDPHGTTTSALVGILQDGKLVRWSPDTVLSYCVLRNTFPQQQWYEEVVANMGLATQAWEQTCGIRFEHVSHLDSSTSVRPSGVVFPVRHISAGGAFVAAGFFPHDPPTRRRILIDPSYFTTTFDHVGVLRHELGHVIGCRHEHIRSGAPPVCPDEDTTGTVDLTAYDPQSVMHYFCGGVGSRRLEITQVDRTGAQLLYGPPLATFELQEA